MPRLPPLLLGIRLSSVFLCGGFGYAFGGHQFTQGGRLKVLSLAELAALQWLTSEEGKLAWGMDVHNRGMTQQCFERID